MSAAAGLTACCVQEYLIIVVGPYRRGRRCGTDHPRVHITPELAPDQRPTNRAAWQYLHTFKRAIPHP